MGLFSKKSDDESIETLVRHISGLEKVFQEHQEVYMVWNDNEKKAIFQNKIYKVFNKIPKGVTLQTVNLGIEKIKRVEIISEKEILEKSKSVGGRAIAGGLLLGPLGAIVGGMSGVGNKQNTKIKQYIVFNYDKDKVITFELSLLPLKSFKIINLIRAHLDIPAEINL